MKDCALCGLNKPLQKSHIIPSFVAKWLKETSVTGYLRQVVNANLRVQDITKYPLLCKDCERLFSVYEGTFSKNIFYPYVNNELNEWGVAQGKIKSIHYNDWLLKFIISVQWRCLITDNLKTSEYEASKIKRFEQIINTTKNDWKNFLKGESKISGEQRHYIIFLQNLISGSGSLPENINKQINFYLLRSADTTLAVSTNNLFLYTKLGPIIIISGIVPSQIKSMDDCLVRKHGNIYTAQHLKNSYVNKFIFITRPNEAMGRYAVSNSQSTKINKDINAKLPKSKNIHSVLAGYSDFLMNKKK